MSISNVINASCITSDAANCHFLSVSDRSVREDVSLLATFRAVCEPHMKEREAFTLSSMEVYRDKDIPSPLPSSLKIICVQNEDKEKAVEMIEAAASNLVSFEKVERLSVFFKQKGAVVDGYVNSVSKSSIVYVASASLSLYHYVVSSIVTVLPYIFNGEKPTEDEMDVLKCLQRNEVSFEDAVKKIVDKCDFKKEFIMKSLTGFGANDAKKRASRLERDIDSQRERIRSCKRELNRVINELSVMTERYNSVLATISSKENDTDLAELFIRSKNIDLISVEEVGEKTNIRFSVTSYMNNFDGDMIERNIAGDRDRIIRPDDRDYSDDIPDDDMLLLMREIFVNQKLKIKFCAQYIISSDGNVEPVGGADLRNYIDCIPNPHIQRFECMSAYTQYVCEEIEAGNFAGAVAQCVASCGSLNVGDPPVFRVFMRALYRGEDDCGAIYNNKCIELPDGTVVAPKDAIAYLKKGEN